MGCGSTIQSTLTDHVMQIRNKRNIEYKNQTFTKKEMVEILECISENNVLEKLIFYNIKITSGI